MLTILDIKERQYKSKILRVFSCFMANSLSDEILQSGDIRVRYLKYINRNSKVNYKKIDKLVGAQRNHLLCNEKLKLPSTLSFKRFKSDEYKVRLCTNTALALLASSKRVNYNIGLIDEKAHHTALPRYILRYTDTLVVVSTNTDVYSDVAKELLEEIGAPIRLSKTAKSLYNCDIIIAPEGIAQGISTKDDCLILTTKKPEFSVNSKVIFDYSVRLSSALSKICPECIDETYFASALYTIGHRFELGSLVPSVCVTNDRVHTFSSLKNLLDNISIKS